MSILPSLCLAASLVVRISLSLSPLCFFPLLLSPHAHHTLTTLSHTGHVLCEGCTKAIVLKTSPRLRPTCPFCREPFTSPDVRLIRIDFTQSSGGGPSGPSADETTDALAVAVAVSDPDNVNPLLHCKDANDPDAQNADDDDESYEDQDRVLVDRRSNVRHPAPSFATGSASASALPQHQQNRGLFIPVDEDSLPMSFDLSRFEPGRHRDRACDLERKVAKVASKRCSVEEVHVLQRELAEWLNVDQTIGGTDPQVSL